MLLIYFSDKHIPPLLKAISLASFNLCDIFKHSGHHASRFFMWYSSLYHSWLLAHFYKSGELELTYFSDRHCPFLLWAICLASSIVWDAFLAQYGHHLLPILIQENLACHSWPFAHLHFMSDQRLIYSSERHIPPLSIATAFTSFNVYLIPISNYNTHGFYNFN